MSLDLQARLKVFLASAPQTINVIEVLEISHSAITTQFFWREPYVGSVTTETGLKTVQPLNFSTKLAGSSGHLDQKFDITLDTTDITDLFRQHLDAIAVNTSEKIRLMYRQYLSDDLTVAQATAVLQVESIAYKLGAATLSAVSPRLNVARTGEVYTPKAIPMLRAFV